MGAADGRPLIIVYHADCIDGAACAWCIAKAHGIDDGPRPQVTYIPYAHHDSGTAEDNIRAALAADAKIYFVDVAPTRGFLDELMRSGPDGAAKVKAVHIMDHHESQILALKDYKPPAGAGEKPDLRIVLDADTPSAAKMVWEEMMPGTPPPPVIDVISMMDGDAQGLATPQDFAAAAWIDTRDIATPVTALDTVRGLAVTTFNQMAKAGRPLAVDQDMKIGKALENMAIVDLQVLPGQPPVPVALVNCDVKQFGRQISSRLVDLADESGAKIALAWYLQKNGVVSMSIRTNGTPDASRIIEHLKKTMGVTGGGHDSSGAVHFASLYEFVRRMPVPGGNPEAPGAVPARRRDPASVH
jgi:hypothetical protein